MERCQKKAGLQAKTIRYYEDIGLITPQRDANGYRSFRDSDMHKLASLGRSRALGFTIEDCRNLLALWDDKDRASADVRVIANKHLAQIESKIVDLQAIRDTLSHLVRECVGDTRPDCPNHPETGKFFDQVGNTPALEACFTFTNRNFRRSTKCHIGAFSQ